MGEFDLGVAVQQMSEGLRALSSRVDVARDLNERQYRLGVLTQRLWKAVLLLTVAVVLSCTAVVYAVHSATDNRASVVAIENTRSESRVVTCRTDNENAAHVNVIVDQDVITLQTAKEAMLANPNVSEESRATATAFYDQRIAGYESGRVPLRDCSPAAIEAYYAQQGN